MKNLIAIGLACCIPIGLAAEDSGSSEIFLGTMRVLAIDEPAPVAKEPACDSAQADAACVSVNRAVLTAHIEKVSVLRERGRWM
jgi:hypothetical protein